MPAIKNEGRDRRDLRDRRSTSHGPEALQQVPEKSNGKMKTKEKTFMDRWVEPSLAAPKASYQDHGGAPYGVLEHMQPLGEAPNAKVKTRVKLDAPKKSLSGRSSAAVPQDAQESREASPAPVSSANIPLPPTVIIDDDDKDGDYAPKTNLKRKERTTRRSVAKRESLAAEPKPEPQAGPKIREYADADPSLPRPVYTEDKLKGVVEAAKSRAICVGKPDLAAAVNEVYEQSMVNLTLRLLLESILMQKATVEDQRTFQDYVRVAKRKLKDEAKSKPTVIDDDDDDDDDDEEDDATSRQHPSNGTQSQALISPTKLVHLPAPNTVASALSSTEQSEHPKPKISLKIKPSATKDSGHLRLSHPAGGMSKSPRKRSDSIGSDSSLTSLTSNEDSDDMDVDDKALRVEPGSPPPPPPLTNGSLIKTSKPPRITLAASSTGVKRTSTEAGLEAVAEAERDRVLTAKKQKFSEGVTRDVPSHEESNIRPTMSTRITRTLPAHTEGHRLAVMPTIKLPALGMRDSINQDSRTASMDIDSPLSSVSTPQSSPRVWKGLPKPTGKRAKTKQSPEKKHQAANGGIGGVGAAGMDSPIGDDDNEELSENNDFCSACGGSGYLLCCDGCDRSFHFSCLDPPMSEDAKELNEPWFCYVCVAKRPIISQGPEKPLRGLFAPLLGGLKKCNPANFMLPSEIRDYFEGVTADRNGNFVESFNKPTRNRPGYSGERPDFKKLRDAKGVIIQCYSCGLSSQGHREIISCDFCTQHWHLDCLDPPLSNAPGLNQEGYKIHDWMCPLHVDKVLRQVDTGLLNRRKIHIRRPRAAKAVETSLIRGSRNNGVIEVIDDDSDDSDSEFYDHDEGGIIYKLPASGIKLDFIDKVKSTRVQQIRDERAHRRARLAASAPSALGQANFAKRPFIEQQLALNLAQFASDNQDIVLGGDRVENLVGTLIAEAPIDVVREIISREDAEKAKSASSAVPPSPPASEQPEQLSAGQRKELLMLQELIRRKLEASPT